MEDFWKSVQTIQAERGADYRAFPLFGAVHWAELLVVLCAMIYRRCREMTRQQILRAVFVLMLADEFMKQAVLLYTGQWNVTYLPLHLCSINIFVCWYDAVHQSRRSKEILYALCLPGAVVAMLSPSWQRLESAAPAFLQHPRSADPLSGPSACWRISPAGSSHSLGAGFSVRNRNADLFPESDAENKLFLSQ